MEESLKSGDLVRLKSGGPIMTVHQDQGEPDWICKWFDGADLKSGVFNKDALEKADKLPTAQLP